MKVCDLGSERRSPELLLPEETLSFDPCLREGAASRAPVILSALRAGVAGLGIAVEVVNEGGVGGGPSMVIDCIGSL